MARQLSAQESHANRVQWRTQWRHHWRISPSHTSGCGLDAAVGRLRRIGRSDFHRTPGASSDDGGPRVGARMGQISIWYFRWDWFCKRRNLSAMLSGSGSNATDRLFGCGNHKQWVSRSSDVRSVFVLHEMCGFFYGRGTGCGENGGAACVQDG